MSLMERIDKHYTEEEALIVENRMIEEATQKKRIQVSRDEILDVLDRQDKTGLGQYASITYVKPVQIKKTKSSWDKTGVDTALARYSGDKDAQWYKDFSDFYADDTKKKDGPIGAVVVTQRYNLHWTSQERYGKNYGAYKDKLANLRMRYGIGISTDGTLGDNNNQREKVAGQTFNQTGNLARDFNMAGSTVKITNYIVDGSGRIVSEIPNDLVKAISYAKKTYSVESTVAQELADNPDAMKEYEAARKEIADSFRSQNFVLDKVLCIVATVDGMGYYYINDMLTTPIVKGGETLVNREDMVKIAEDQLDQTFNDIPAEKFATE